ncbi:PepSY-associated TM helix domain-containing protein [Paraburkholderia kururiensis]|uniref:PepSY-associated TM helix domain-containing protein n=1 Tax=Paraburkholderia kururiensis TaxID=984307 RepID=A0ABZ0WGA6_9BURK|nr:PepSY-associated TM helix domain-containing protein [Paraburkholderia kururiensis]WQD76372.1 PepSY-associated TM helix domain-containing protein [Paraburkholderia kururiensis]
MNAPESIDALSPMRSTPITAKPVAAAALQSTSTLPRIDDVEEAARRQRWRRANFIKWLRNVHGWIGLWGAVIGLMFGVTGFLLNHRGGPLKVSTGEPRVEQVQVALPDTPPRSPQEMMRWLQRELKIDGKPGRVRREPAHPVAWGDQRTVQPEFWQITLAAPGHSVQAEYWVGNGYVSVKNTSNTFFATLTNLHRGVGVSLVWVLLMDTIAGSLILLSLTGVLLWTELHKKRTVGVVLVLGSVAAALAAGLM